MKSEVVWVSFVVVIITQCVNSYSVLHKILKVNETASVGDLEIAYEKLLRKWYKASTTLSIDAELLHLKIVQAYRELKTKMEINFHQKYLSFPEYYKSNMQPLDINVLHNTSIPLREINEISMKNSSKNLHLILFYSVNSSGVQIIHSWFNLLKMLCPLGIVMVSINMDNEDLRTARNVFNEYPPPFPYLVLLIDGVIVPYKSDEFIDFMIIDFIRRNLPDNLLQAITDMSAKKFLNSWHADNKVRALVFQPTLPIRLQYLLIAFRHGSTVLFGFVNLSDEKVWNLQKLMNVSSNIDTFLLFKEDQEIPQIKITMPSIPIKLLNDTISRNSFLILPRITSQQMFDTICPISSSFSGRTSLCVILIIQNSLNVRAADPKITFRKFIQEYSGFFRDLSFMYMYKDYQPGFTLPIKENESLEISNKPYIVALERIDRNRVKYAFLMYAHRNWQDYENTKEQLKSSIEEVIKGREMLLVDTLSMNNFVIEKPPTLLQRIIYRLQEYFSRLTLENLLSYFIFLATVIYFLAYFTSHWNKFQWSVLQVQCLWNILSESENQKLIKLNEAKMPLQPRKKNEFASSKVFIKNGKCITPSRELRLHELKAETYNGMVRLLKPGCRTIILMFDRERADLLVSQFYKAVWPYRKNKNLLFGYVNMEKKAALEWYSELVKACLPDQQDIEINPYFCAGTVLALSGMRKYFCLHHLKHPGILSNKDKTEIIAAPIKNTFSDEELLMGLREWLDKLFDGSGSVIRYQVNHWPDFKIL